MKKILLALAGAGMLFGCGQSGPGSDAAKPQFLASGVQAVSTAPEVKTYAASRFLDHASFGPTPAAIADVKARGLAGWIDYQFTVEPSQWDAAFAEDWDSNLTPGKAGVPYYEITRREFLKANLSGEDQLRQRVTWALSQFIVVSESKVQVFAGTQYVNMLQRSGLGNFADLLRTVAKDPSVGNFLDNYQNKKEGSCGSCSVNENFARELMQLFTLGVTKLNKDGSVMRDANGKLIETYTQDDVQAMARALTGWTFISPVPAPNLRFTQYRYPMVARNTNEHDSGEKKLLGKTIPAGGTAESDLNAAIEILMTHPNIAPFVSLRMIQHLTTSNPSPAYLTRVASVFEDNGSGVRGDMKAVVRAILLDPEARAGDDPSKEDPNFGIMRQPVLQVSAILRGMGCTSGVRQPDGNLYVAWNQMPFNAASVFSFFAPTYRAPGSNLLAPEQKLLTSNEFSQRLSGLTWAAGEAPANITAAGCKVDEFVTALQKSNRDFLNLVSQRYFRGNMPPTVRDFGETILANVTSGTPTWRTVTTIHLLLTTPTFGVIK